MYKQGFMLSGHEDPTFMITIIFFMKKMSIHTVQYVTLLMYLKLKVTAQLSDVMKTSPVTYAGFHVFCLIRF